MAFSLVQSENANVFRHNGPRRLAKECIFLVMTEKEFSDDEERIL